MQCVFCLKSINHGVLFLLPRTICHGCAERLEQSKSPLSRTFYHRCVGQIYSSYSLTSLYGYDGLIRDLFWSVKVRMDRHCARLLLGLFLRSEEVWMQALHADLIMVAPSSLWSRLRGRVDLAYLLATELSTMTAKPLLHSPPSCYWRAKKRARVKHAHGQQWSVVRRLVDRVMLRIRLMAIRWLPQTYLFSMRESVDAFWYRRNRVFQYRQLLLIDDVATTGETLRNTIMRVQLARRKFHMIHQIPEEEIKIRCLSLAHSNL